MTAQDPALQPIAVKVARNQRLTRDDALELFNSPDLLTLGRLADSANRRLNADRVHFAANQHINPTNVCVLRNTCVFCSFARMPREAGAYTRSLEEVFAEADAARDNPTREFHIVGGLHPKLRLAYYLDMFRGLQQRHPGVHIKALTAVEVAHLARLEHSSVRDVVVAMRAAGVTSLPGGGAELVSPAARAALADKKLSGEEWLAVHREAHRLGTPSDFTMLSGHGGAGAGTPMWLGCDQVVSLIRGAGKEAAERDSLYHTVRTFEDWVPAEPAVRPQGPEGPAFQISHRAKARARGQRSLPVLSAVDGSE